uniref:Uncharacterized protein n=1 Tax=Meleagris gallopavo TaxID=9103 RepID=A0A803YN89_MELGA
GLVCSLFVLVLDLSQHASAGPAPVCAWHSLPGDSTAPSGSVSERWSIYLKNKDLYTVEANNPRQLVEIAARDIEKLLSNRSKALVVRHDM